MPSPLPPARRARTPAKKARQPARKAWPPQPDRVAAILRELHRLYPAADCELDRDNPFQLLCATILSAQCTDERVNTVTPALFARFPTPAAMAKAQPGAIEDIIRSTGPPGTSCSTMKVSSTMPNSVGTMSKMRLRT